MYNDPFIRKILFFYNNNKLLSFFLLANLIFFILLREKFYVVFFFIFLLYFAGLLMVKKINNFQLVFSYIIGLVIGGSFFLIWQKNAFSISETSFISAGMQSAIICVLTAITAYTPNHSLSIVFTRLKLKYITAALVIVNLLSVQIPAIYLAHMGGAVAGLLFGFVLKYTFEQRWHDFFSFLNFFTFKKPKMKAGYNYSRPLNDDDYNAQRAEKQKKIDQILDKISKSGYESLSKDEKETLFSANKN